MRVTAQVLKQLFDACHGAVDATGLLEQALGQLSGLPELSMVAILVHHTRSPHQVRAWAAHGLSKDAVEQLGAYAPRGAGAVHGTWPAQLVPPELPPGARFCAVPLASREQVTVLCDGDGDLESLSVLATFLALALERDDAVFDARRLGDLFNAGRVVVFRWRYAADWPVEDVSPNVTKEFGWTVERLLEQPYAPLVHPEDLQRVGGEVAEALARGDSYFAQQYRVLDASGQAREIYDFTHVIRDAAGVVTHFHGYVFDDGERVRAERAKAELTAQLQQAQKLQAVGTLAGGIAHDFNNILAAILAHLELARLEPALANHPDLEAAMQAGNRGRDLVRQLLVFGRARVEERLPHRLQRIIEDSMATVRSTIPPGIGLRLSLDPKTPPVLADAAQLQQVLVNLVTNAAQAMPQGGMVDICLSPRTRGEVWAELTVKDSGVGMAPGVLARALEPFFTTQPIGQGAGLGLSMVHAIVRAHQGTLDLQSTPGVGTTVVVSLPGASHEPAALGGAALERGAQQRVALVDDEPLVARATERLVSHFGYAVTPLASGKAVLAAFEARRDAFDLVLTDQTMPEMTGLELTQALRAKGLRVPVLLVTGLPMEIDLAGVAPPFAVLGKPYRSDELAAALATLFARARQAR